MNYEFKSLESRIILNFNHKLCKLFLLLLFINQKKLKKHIAQFSIEEFRNVLLLNEQYFLQLLFLIFHLLFNSYFQQYMFLPTTFWQLKPALNILSMNNYLKFLLLIPIIKSFKLIIHTQIMIMLFLHDFLQKVLMIYHMLP